MYVMMLLVLWFKNTYFKGFMKTGVGTIVSLGNVCNLQYLTQNRKQNEQLALNFKNRHINQLNNNLG